ncbi:MAG: hypothetical protein CM1200mP7_1920 [Chloroflexota bacterium]|nr:MAG: hypothetical protein CM1200mP7_1920 [Chloroflexota bacterium]
MASAPIFTQEEASLEILSNILGSGRSSIYTGIWFMIKKYHHQFPVGIMAKKLQANLVFKVQFLQDLTFRKILTKFRRNLNLLLLVD